MTIEIGKIRNVGVVGHGGVGKTSLVEAMLFTAGAVTRLGKVDDGSTTTDLYNSAGQKTSEVRNYADGSSLTTNYNTSGAVTQTVAKAAGASTTTNYSAGVQVIGATIERNGGRQRRNGFNRRRHHTPKASMSMPCSMSGLRR